MPDGDFTVCRLEYTRVVIEDMGVGWQTDYPFSERNLMTRLSELTKTPISRDERKEPNTWVVRATDPQLFNCPYVVASDAGTIGLTPAEVQRSARLPVEGRVPGGWTTSGARLPGSNGRVRSAACCPRRSIRLTTCRSTDPLLRSLYHRDQVPQITNIQFWRSFQGGVTSERGDGQRGSAPARHSRSSMAASWC